SEAASQAVGIDVGGTKIVALRVSGEGKELARSVRPTPADDMDATLATLVAALGDVSDPDVVAVGVGAAGLVEEGTGVLRFAPNLAWRDAPIAEVVGRAAGTRVIVENDCTAGAYGEYRVGAARGVAHVLYIGVGTGIGGGLILGGSLYRGAHGFAAEVGHIVVEPDGPVCGCGNRGCWETVASGSAITREGRAAARRHAPLAARPGGDTDAVPGHTAVDGRPGRDAAGGGIVTETGRPLASAGRAAAAGFDAVFASDHLFPPGAPERPSLEPYTLLAAIGAVNPGLGVGVLVTRAGFRPVGMLAKQAAALDHVTGGHAVLGLGVGDANGRAEHAALGLDYPPFPERLALLEETVLALRALFAGSPWPGRQRIPALA